MASAGCGVILLIIGSLLSISFSKNTNKLLCANFKISNTIPQYGIWTVHHNQVDTTNGTNYSIHMQTYNPLKQPDPIALNWPG